MNITELREEVMKILTSEHNKNVKITRINEAFTKYENCLAESSVVFNPSDCTGDPDAPEGLTINTKGELQGDFKEDDDLGEDTKPAA